MTFIRRRNVVYQCSGQRCNPLVYNKDPLCNTTERRQMLLSKHCSLLLPLIICGSHCNEQFKHDCMYMIKMIVLNTIETAWQMKNKRKTANCQKDEYNLYKSPETKMDMPVRQSICLSTCMYVSSL